MKSLYLVSTLEKSINHVYKFGRHTGVKNKLISRYRTYFIDVCLFYFKSTNHYSFIENAVLKELAPFIVRDLKGKKTEWIRLELCKIVQVIDKLIDTYC